ELELKGKPTGLKLDLDSVTLRRGDRKIAKIERVPPPDKGEDKKSGEPEVAVGEVRLLPWGSVVVHAVSPDGSLALAGEYGGSELVLWHLAKGKVVHRLKRHRAAIRDASFSPDGKKIVSCSALPDDSIHIWDVKSGKVLSSF